MKSFTQYIQESGKEITIAVGKFSLPTARHGDIFETAQKTAMQSQYRIYTLNSANDLIEYTQRVKYIRKMFPRHARSVILNESNHNIFDILNDLYSEGFCSVNLVCEQDRVAEYDTLVNKYNGSKSRGGFYHFEGGVNVISSGILSESLMTDKVEHAIASNDFQSFMKGMPSGFKEAKDLFNDVRKGMGLSESHDFRTHIQLQPVSEAREAYVSGDLFKEGDCVVITESEEVGSITFLGANYVIVETGEGKKYRKWISDVERLDEGENVDRAKEDYEQAKEAILQRMEQDQERAEQELEALEDTFERELEDAERRDEIEDEDEVERDAAEQQDEAVKSFQEYFNKSKN